MEKAFVVGVGSFNVCVCVCVKGKSVSVETDGAGVWGQRQEEGNKLCVS